MKIRGKEYELVEQEPTTCNHCAFVCNENCKLDVGQLPDNDSCFSAENVNKVYKEVK